MKNYLTVLVILVSLNFAYGQNSKLSAQLEVGGIRGIQLSKTFPILKSGGLAKVIVGKKLGDYVQFGAGVSYIQLEDESFIPLFVHCKASRNKNGNGLFYNTSIGYSQATNSTFDNAVYSQYIGKMYFSPGMGYQYSINEKWGLTAGVNYVLQKVDLEHYTSENVLYHTESLTLDLVVFKVGITLF